jgi:hypothetical protein
MKIGLSSGDLSRLLTNHKNYNVLIDSSRFIPVSEKRLAMKLEKFFLDNIPKLNYDLKTEDGYTEVRDAKWAKEIKPLLQQVKKNPIFSHIDTKRVSYKLFKIDELIEKLKISTDISILEKQYQKLKLSNKSSVEKRKWKRVYESGRYWSKSYYVEDK